MATKLESLSISCTNPLNFDLFLQNRLYGLKNLSLSHINATGEYLSRFLTQNQLSIETICFEEVDLISKTWEDVLVQLCKFPLLLEVSIDDCGYAVDGVSSQLRLRPEVWEDPENLESSRLRDKYALGDIIKLINPRRRGRGLCEIHPNRKWYVRYEDGTLG